jgi:hypothetical protein
VLDGRGVGAGVLILIPKEVLTMSKKENVANTEAVERRKHWRDRRAGADRRNPQRLRLVSYDCRSGLPRRQADLSGELSDGEIWWNEKKTQYE